MKKVLVLIVLVALFLPGCAIFRDKDMEEKVDVLDKRVTSVEKRQASLEVQVEEEEYVTAVKAGSTTSESSASISMSKKQIQMDLKNAGYYDAAIDGKIGAKSQKAIRDFQADHGLKVDGIVGPRTKKELIEYLDIK